jgi:hypothetical protein
MTVALIVTAAIVAVICDFLKRNNEQLREMNIELKVRQEHHLVPRPPKAEEIAAPPAPIIAAPKERSIVNPDKKRTVNSGAIAAMERGAALAAKRVPSASIIARHAPAAAPQPTIELVPEIVTPAKTDWGSLLSRSAQGRKVAPMDGSLPAGLQDGFVLNKLVESRQPVSGLVVSIGVNASSKSGDKLPAAVSKLVQSLIGPNDFAAQSGDDEFLLIYPQEHGASAQRRLSLIARQLWDFQLRSLGSFQILFSWGGVEVRSESLEEAIASASERMRETKRGRKLVTMELPALAAEQVGALRKAV